MKLNVPLRKITIACILNIVSIHSFSQISNVNHWETIVKAEDTFKYQTNNNSITDNNWRDNDYDDSSWSEGLGGIGFGDNDDNTVINGITSVFLRKEFTVINKSEIAAAILNVDYDDAFVAYLNGVEIVRSEGLNDTYPSYNVLSSQQHDAVLPKGEIPTNYIVNKVFLQTNLIEGTNTLAVQVHNASTTSSDLSSNTWFSLGVNVETVRYTTVPSWFSAPLTGFSSNLPILIIDTENGTTITDEPKTTAHLGIIYNGEGERNYSDETYTDYDGNIGIEIRGNSTADFPKKPYNFETRDSLGENLNVALLGMPKENDWVLRASYLDHTFIRNALADHMARETGFWAPNTRHVEIILNGNYQGIYVLMEDIKRDDERVDIAKLDSSDIAGEDLTGGYIWELTGFGSNFGERRKLKYPAFEDVTAEQLAYIRAFDDAFRNKMAQSSSIYADPNTGYVEHIWVESFIAELMVQEGMRNGDAYCWSGYYHKDKNGLINAGPVWDFDQSSGTSSYPDNGVIDGWLIEHPSITSIPDYWKLLLQDPYFKYSLYLRWNELRANKFSNDKLIAYVDSIATLLSEAQAREFDQWPVLGKNIWRETTGYQERNTYQKEVDYLESFLIERWNWIDTQLLRANRPTGYPEITVTNEISSMKAILAQKKTYINLNEIFSYPYSPELKFSAYSSDTNILETDVKKSDSVKIKFQDLGTCNITLTATDTYGNKKSTFFAFEVTNTISATSNIDANMASLIVFPNPASNSVNFQLKGNTNNIVNIELYNCTGQMIDQVYQGQYTSSINYNCSQLSNGVYFVKLRTEDQQAYTQKFIVNR